jgi:methylenetetrahydrofolate dehydrogenase (NADP+)/methenyltetrahydrofolate cyclohydrolase
MTAKILEGKTLASEIRRGLESRIAAVIRKRGRAPRLSAVSAEEDYASALYLKKELEACARAGIETEVKTVTAAMSAAEFAEVIKEMGANPGNDAVLIPQPLPKRLASAPVWDVLDPYKDIDGASVVSMGRLFKANRFSEIDGNSFFPPCTALAVIRLLGYHNIEVRGRRITVIGRSATVGRPLAHMLTCLDATVTLCHSRSEDIAAIASRSDIVLSAVGKARWLGPEMVAGGAVLVDVGTNQDAQGKFCGDADYEAIAPKVSAITPVPGGVGPVTLACLLENIVRPAERGS